jgi:hypothetical protein
MISIAFMIVMLAMVIIGPSWVMADTHGYVNIGGYISFQPRNWDGQHMQTGSELKVDLYEHPLLDLPPVLWTGLKGEFMFKIDRAVVAQSRV